MIKLYRLIAILLVLGFIPLGSACQRNTAKQTFSDELTKTRKIFSDKKMLHLKQVVEYYDAAGNPLPRYFELFVADGKKTSYELDSDGYVIQVYQDTKDTHISYDMESMKARKYDASPIFSLDLDEISKDKNSEIVKLEAYKYSGRDCHVYGILSGNDDDNIKLYVDDKTGYVLFCDTPMFCIKTASIEVIDYDSGYFGLPEDLIYE